MPSAGSPADQASVIVGDTRVACSAIRARMRRRCDRPVIGPEPTGGGGFAAGSGGRAVARLDLLQDLLFAVLLDGTLERADPDRRAADPADHDFAPHLVDHVVGAGLLDRLERLALVLLGDHRG